MADEPPLVDIKIHTRKPGKWRFVDTETGQVWMWDVERGTFVLAPPSCRHCGREIEDKATPCMSGSWEPKWVHYPGGYQICFPQEAGSPRAEPR